jgi:hypothetical protein
MNLQHDNDISELHPRKGKPSECWRVLEKKPEAHSVNGRIQGRPVVRSPEELHVHPALLELHGLDIAVELNEAERTRDHLTTPVAITSEGTILSGFGRWRSKLLHGEPEVQCIEYALAEEDSLQFILVNHKPQRGWNAFVRTCLAIKLEPYFQHRALDNMRAGGKYKGSAKLPNPQHIDVRRQIAAIAGVGARNVSNVKLILRDAHPRLLIALANGTLTINKALTLCKLPLRDQLEAFTQLVEERAIDTVIQHTLARSRYQKPFPHAASMLAAFQLCESRHPGSVVVRRGPSGRTTISVPSNLLDRIDPQMEMQPDEATRSTQKPPYPDPFPLGPG